LNESMFHFVELNAIRGLNLLTFCVCQMSYRARRSKFVIVDTNVFDTTRARNMQTRLYPIPQMSINCLTDETTRLISSKFPQKKVEDVLHINRKVINFAILSSKTANSSSFFRVATVPIFKTVFDCLNE
jgi:hypothetical protein